MVFIIFIKLFEATVCLGLDFRIFGAAACQQREIRGGILPTKECKKRERSPKKSPEIKSPFSGPFFATMTARADDGPGSNYQLFMQKSKARQGKAAQPHFNFNFRLTVAAFSPTTR